MGDAVWLMAALFAKFPVPPLSPEAASAMQSKSALEALKYAQDGAEAKFWRLRVQSVFGQDPIEYYNELKARSDDAVPAFQRAVEMADVEQGFDEQRLLIAKSQFKRLQDERVKVLTEGMDKGFFPK